MGWGQPLAPRYTPAVVTLVAAARAFLAVPSTGNIERLRAALDALDGD